MKRKTILALSLAAATIAGAAVAIPAVAGDWTGGPCGPGAMWGHGGMPGMKMWRMGSYGPAGAMGPMNSPVFRSFDADKDGTVRADEARAGLAALHGKYDADGDGALAATEFATLFTEATRGFSERPFNMLDENGDGRISAEEMTFPARMMARFALWTSTAPSGK